MSSRTYPRSGKQSTNIANNTSPNDEKVTISQQIPVDNIYRIDNGCRVFAGSQEVTDKVSSHPTEERAKEALKKDCNKAESNYRQKNGRDAEKHLFPLAVRFYGHDLWIRANPESESQRRYIQQVIRKKQGTAQLA